MNMYKVSMKNNKEEKINKKQDSSLNSLTFHRYFCFRIKEHSFCK